MIFDLVQAAFIVGMITALVVMTAALITAGTLLVILGIWTAVISIWSLPALVVLYRSPPRVPLSQRSALVASAKWFGNAIWAAVVFVLSIALGTIAGILASTVADNETDVGTALNSALAVTAQVVLGPVLATVAAIAYLITGVRWLRDLEVISDEGGAEKVWIDMEHRWFGPAEQSGSGGGGRALIVWFAGNVTGRVGLILTLVTIFLNIAITLIVIASP